MSQGVVLVLIIPNNFRCFGSNAQPICTCNQELPHKQQLENPLPSPSLLKDLHDRYEMLQAETHQSHLNAQVVSREDGAAQLQLGERAHTNAQRGASCLPEGHFTLKYLLVQYIR